MLFLLSTVQTEITRLSFVQAPHFPSFAEMSKGALNASAKTTLRYFTFLLFLHPSFKLSWLLPASCQFLEVPPRVSASICHRAFSPRRKNAPDLEIAWVFHSQGPRILAVNGRLRILSMCTGAGTTLRVGCLSAKTSAPQTVQIDSTARGGTLSESA
jgi:hypothetical protein